MTDAEAAAALIAAAAEDGRVRTRLAESGALFDGYHPEMRAVHDANAALLDSLLGGGWPDATRVGAAAAEAAWLIAQHAIAQPALQRRALAALAESAAPRWQAAMLADRIAVMEGRPQRYGTQFDWDADGMMAPNPIADPAEVDARRAAVGLEPLADAIVRHRAESGPAPTDPTARKAAYRRFLIETGWRVAQSGDPA